MRQSDLHLMVKILWK